MYKTIEELATAIAADSSFKNAKAYFSCDDEIRLDWIINFLEINMINGDTEDDYKGAPEGTEVTCFDVRKRLFGKGDYSKDHDIYIRVYEIDLPERDEDGDIVSYNTVGYDYDNLLVS